MAKQMRVTVRNNIDNETIIIDSDKTVKDAFRQANIAIESATITFDGIPLTATECNKRLNELTGADEALIMAIVKTNNA